MGFVENRWVRMDGWIGESLVGYRYSLLYGTFPLKMEADEWEEVVEAGMSGGDLGREWVLGKDERRRARGLLARS